MTCLNEISTDAAKSREFHRERARMFIALAKVNSNNSRLQRVYTEAAIRERGDSVRRPYLAMHQQRLLEQCRAALTDCVASLAGYRREMEMFAPGMCGTPCDAEQMALFTLHAISEVKP